MSLCTCPLAERMSRHNSSSEKSSEILTYRCNDGECDCLQTPLLRIGVFCENPITLHVKLLCQVLPGRHIRMLWKGTTAHIRLVRVHFHTWHISWECCHYIPGRCGRWTRNSLHIIFSSDDYEPSFTFFKVKRKALPWNCASQLTVTFSRSVQMNSSRRRMPSQRILMPLGRPGEMISHFQLTHKLLLLSTLVPE